MCPRAPSQFTVSLLYKVQRACCWRGAPDGRRWTPHVPSQHGPLAGRSPIEPGPPEVHPRWRAGRRRVVVGAQRLDLDLDVGVVRQVDAELLVHLWPPAPRQRPEGGHRGRDDGHVGLDDAEGEAERVGRVVLDVEEDLVHVVEPDDGDDGHAANVLVRPV